jgi:hypothetical protein
MIATRCPSRRTSAGASRAALSAATTHLPAHNRIVSTRAKANAPVRLKTRERWNIGFNLASHFCREGNDSLTGLPDCRRVSSGLFVPEGMPGSADGLGPAPPDRVRGRTAQSVGQPPMRAAPSVYAKLTNEQFRTHSSIFDQPFDRRASMSAPHHSWSNS